MTNQSELKLIDECIAEGADPRIAMHRILGKRLELLDAQIITVTRRLRFYENEREKIMNFLQIKWEDKENA